MFLKNLKMLGAILFLSETLLANSLALDDVYKQALEKAESLRISESELRVSEVQTDKARSDFFPSLSLNSSYLRQNKILPSVNEYDQQVTKLNFSQSLYAGGKDSSMVNAAKANVKSLFYKLEESKNSFYIQVAQVFYAQLSAEREVENTKKSIELTKKRLEELDRRKKIGKSRNIELLAAQSQLSILEAHLLASLGELQVAKNNFYLLTGLDSKISLKEDASLPQENRDLKTLLSSLEQRPDLLALNSHLRSTEELVGAARSEFLPNLDVSANYYLSRTNSSSNAPDWDASLTLTIPLFSKGLTSAEVKEAQERRMQAELLLNQKRRNAETEIKSAYHNFMSFLEQVKALEKAVVATEQNYKQQERDYRFSLATNLDVIQALNTLDETKRSLDKTRYQALYAAAILKATVNELKK